MYWVTETSASAARLYWEHRNSEDGPEFVAVPTGVARYPKEMLRFPRPWVERRYNVTHWADMPRGGHFAAMEQPELFADDVRTFFCPVPLSGLPRPRIGVNLQWHEMRSAATRGSYLMGMLDGKVAVITGAGSGMARAAVEIFVREGAKVVAGDISGAEKDTAAELGAGVLPVHCDVTNEADVEALVRAAVDEFGRFDTMLQRRRPRRRGDARRRHHRALRQADGRRPARRARTA